MGIPNSTSIHIDPRTKSHLRWDLTRIKKLLDSISGSIGNPSGTFPSAVDAGTPVYVSASDTLSPADASALATAQVVGLANEDIGAGGTGEYVTHGRVTKADWTSIIGAAALTAGSVYYLSTTTGDLTTTAPTTVGEVVVRIGIALSTTTLNVNVEEPILL